MKHYTILKLIKGYKLKPSLKGLTLVGVPFHCRKHEIMVNYGGIRMLVNKNSRLLHQEMFRDKYRPNRHYVLYYYEWKPNTMQKTLF